MSDKVELDNRDISTTRVWVEVDVFELFTNALENAGMTEEHLTEVIDYLEFAYLSKVERGERSSTLSTGLDFLLQALRHPDHNG